MYYSIANSVGPALFATSLKATTAPKELNRNHVYGRIKYTRCMYVSSPRYILYYDSLYPGVYFVLGQNIHRGIHYPRGVYSVLGQNIPRGIKYPRTEYTRV